MSVGDFTQKMWSKHIQDNLESVCTGSGTDILKPLICQCCGGHIDRNTLRCPYCETQYNGKLQQMPKIIYGERRDYDILNASVCIDENLFLENQALAQKIAMEKLTQAMMRGLEPYIEIKEHKDHRSFSRYITGAIRIYRKYVEE